MAYVLTDGVQTIMVLSKKIRQRRQYALVDVAKCGRAAGLA